MSSQQKLKSFCKWFKENKNYKGEIVEPQGNEWYLIDSIDSNHNSVKKKLNFE